MISITKSGKHDYTLYLQIYENSINECSWYFNQRYQGVFMISSLTEKMFTFYIKVTKLLLDMAYKCTS